MTHSSKVVPHPDGSGDLMVDIPEELWERAQSCGWREGDRYFITRKEDSLHLYRLTSETMKPAKSIPKCRFKRELNQHLKELKENQAIAIGDSEFVVVKASMYQALISLIHEIDSDTSERNRIS